MPRRIVSDERIERLPRTGDQERDHLVHQRQLVRCNPDSLSQDFTGHTNAAPSSDKDILVYGVGTGFVTITGTSIGVAVPPGTNLTSLVAGFLTTGVRGTVGGVTQPR
jgi:hypothetical protein